MNVNRPIPSHDRFAVRRMVVCTLLFAVFVGARLAGAPDAHALQPAASPSGATDICASGRLRIGNLPTLQDAWRISVQADTQGAREWQDDAVLISASVTCGFLADEARIRTMFYSASAHGTWDPETDRFQPLDPGDPDPKALPADKVSFSMLYQALTGLGLTDDDLVGASGMTVRLNSYDPPFGPASVPDETPLVHLTVGDGAATQDVYIDAESGRTFTFDPASGRTGVNG